MLFGFFILGKKKSFGKTKHENGELMKQLTEHSEGESGGAKSAGNQRPLGGSAHRARIHKKQLRLGLERIGNAFQTGGENESELLNRISLVRHQFNGAAAIRQINRTDERGTKTRSALADYQHGLRAAVLLYAALRTGSQNSSGSSRNESFVFSRAHLFRDGLRTKRTVSTCHCRSC